MKKLTIFKRSDKIERDGTFKNEVLRSICVHSSFIGIGKNGQINGSEFKKLAQDLEPTSTGISVIDI